MGQIPGGGLPGIPAPAALGGQPTSYGDVPYEDVVTNAPARNSGFGVNTDRNPFDYQNAEFGQPSASGGNALVRLRHTSINPPEEYSGLVNLIWDRSIGVSKAGSCLRRSLLRPPRGSSCNFPCRKKFQPQRRRQEFLTLKDGLATL